MTGIFLGIWLALGASRACSQGVWPELSNNERGAGGGEKDAAVIVGVESFAKVAPVPGAIKNADDWHSYLTGALNVPVDRVSLLRDDEATLELMREKAKKAASEVEPGGTLWFVYIGHGAPSRDGKDGLLVGWDAQQRADSLFSRSLSQKELLALLGAGKQARTVLLVDACFSGRTPSGEPLVKGLQPLIIKADAGTAQVAQARTILLTAAKSDQFAGPLPGGGRPAFSYLALGGLRGWADEKGEGKVTAESLWRYVGKALRALGVEQEPELAAFRSGQVLSSGGEKGPDLGAIVRERKAPEQRSAKTDFQVTELPSVPKAEAPKALDPGASGLDLGNIDVESLEKYDAVYKFDQGQGSAAEKAARWRTLAKEAPKYADLAGKRAAEWDRFAAQEKAAEQAKQKRLAARDGDWAKLSRLLALSVVPDADKRQWSAQFVKAYLESPGIEPACAAELAKHLEPGLGLDEIQKLASQAPPPAEESRPQAPARRPGSPAGIEWVSIPAGHFMMGAAHDPRDDVGAAIAGSMFGLPVMPQEHPTEPVHRVEIKAFKLAKTAVTNRQYKACVDAGACSAPDSSCLSEALRGDDQPVVCVDWNQAKAFAEWVGGRLPAEAEWEYAARGAGKAQRYPWGSQGASCERAVMDEGGSGCGKNATSPVCSKAKGNTAQGLCDMAGNVRQWVSDSYHSSYDGAPDDGTAWDDGGNEKVGRGGSWYSSANDLLSTGRGHYSADARNDYLGFRPARD